MKTRFDLEQEIMECWRVVDDVGEDTVLGQYYTLKFEKLWDTFTEVFQIDDYRPEGKE